MKSFFFGLLLLCASALMYEVVLTRLLSVVSWYYLAFVSVSMAMFGMTAGALFVHLRPEIFAEEWIGRRMYQATIATAISMPLVLLTMLAIPLDLSRSLQTVYSFLLFSSVIAVPFFFSGVAVCLSLTRAPFPIGRIYFTDLAGAALGCIGSVVLLSLIDAPSAIFAISALLFVSAAAYASYAKQTHHLKASLYWAMAMMAIAGLNASTIYGIQPIWSKGAIDHRSNIAAELWNPISKVRVFQPQSGPPSMRGPSPRMPKFDSQEIILDIDNNAGTTVTYFTGDLAALQFLRYDVTSLGAQLRAGGTAAIIGVGGGRDVLNAALNGYRRIVGIEVNGAIVNLTSKRLELFSGFGKIPGFELHNDEGRAYLTRSGERFDLIQASLVDTWAATSAGAMTLTENALYTVDGWRVFFDHLKPGGMIVFSRWFTEGWTNETYRLFSVAHAMLLSEGVSDPEQHLALIKCGVVATLIASNQPFTDQELNKLKAISTEMAFTPIVMPGEPISVPELRGISATRTREEMAALRNKSDLDYSPTYDASPYFFNAVHLPKLLHFIRTHNQDPNLRAILFLLAFMLAAAFLVISIVIVPARLLVKWRIASPAAPTWGLAYFLAIGLGFMLVEMAMMQQLSIFLGAPIYSMVVVLGGLILSAGLGSLASDSWPVKFGWQSGIPAIAVSLVVLLYSLAAVPVIHAFTARVLWQRVLVCLVLVFPCGYFLGFCFPVGMRRMTALSQRSNLPWMWALNGAAGTLGSFAAMLISMDTSIRTCALTGAACYLLAGLLIPGASFRSGARFAGPTTSTTLRSATPSANPRHLNPLTAAPIAPTDDPLDPPIQPRHFLTWPHAVAIFRMRWPRVLRISQ